MTLTNIIPVVLAALTVSVGLFLILEAFQRTSPDQSRSRLQFPSRQTVRNYYSLFERNRVLSAVPFVTNLVGTITSLATVYIFFIGNAKAFGWLIFLCPLTIYLSAFMTNALTARLINTPKLAKELHEENRQHFTAVLARLLWEDSSEGIIVSRIAKWISIITILAIIWIELSIAVDLASHLTVGSAGLSNLAGRVVAIVLIAAMMLYFVFRYGVRGVAVGDVLLTPIVAFATIALLVATIAIFIADGTKDVENIQTFFRPSITSTFMLIMFAIQVVVVNLFTIVSTEAHWLRVWAYTRTRTLKSQGSGLLIAAAIWTLLCLVGFFAYYIAHIGADSVLSSELIVGSLLQLVEQKFGAAFLMLFWAGATAALFCTIDAQLYSLLLCWNFNPKTGIVSNPPLPGEWKTFAQSLGCGALFGAFYGLTRFYQIQVEAIAFFMIPLSLTLLASLTRLSAGRRPNASAVVVPIFIYGLCMVLFLVRPDDGLFWALVAPISSLLVALPNGLVSGLMRPAVLAEAEQSANN